MNFLPYIVVSLIAILFGQVVAHLNKKLPPVVSDEITYKEFFKNLNKNFKVDIKYSLIFLILFNLLIYFNGSNITTYLYLIILFSLAMVVSIDIRFQLIPDESHIIILFAGIINFFLNLENWWSYILGAIVGGLIFWLLNLIALIILKKEGMGFGDVKLMASLGFMFGIKNILVIALVAFFAGAIVGIIILIVKRKEGNAYMAFGPFIALGAVTLMFVPADIIIDLYIIFCSNLGTKITDIIFYFMK